MRRRFLSLSIALLSALSLASFVVPRADAAVITLSSGDELTVSDLTFKDGQASFRLGTETRTIPRQGMRDISLSGETQAFAQLATEAGDLPLLMGKAESLLQKYPDSASILVLDEGDYWYNPDGTRKYRYRGVVFLAKEEALGNAEMAIGVDPNRERVRIIHARSFNPNGVLSDLPLDQIKVAKGSSGGEYFNQDQQINFTIPKAEVGCLIDYCYESEEYNPFDRKLWQGYFSFQGTDPVGDSICRVHVPRSFDLPFITTNMSPIAAKPEITETGDLKTYAWKMTDQSPIIGEPLMPPLRDILPSVVFSAQREWKYSFDRLKPMFEKRFTLTDAVKRKVDELTTGARTLEEKISRVYLFCQKEIRYISIKGNLSSNQVGHPAEETLRNKYGDCTDKGMLLATMLKHLGVEAYPVGIRTNPAGKAIREIPIFDSNHCITEVNLDGRRFYLDSTATDYRYPYFRADDHDTIAENALAGRLDPIPPQPPEANAFKVIRTLKLTPDGTVAVTFDSESTGTTEADSRFSARNSKPEEYEKGVRATIAALTADYRLDIATHTDPLDFSAPFRTRSAYTLNRFASRSGRYMIFEIPFFRMRFGEVSLAKRTYDIVYLTTTMRTDEITLALPPGFRVKFMPAPLRLQTPYVDFTAEFKQDGDQIRIFRQLAFLKRVVPAKEYAQHQEVLERISRFTEERLFLEEVPADKPAPALPTKPASASQTEGGLR